MFIIMRVEVGACLKLTNAHAHSHPALRVFLSLLVVCSKLPVQAVLTTILINKNEKTIYHLHQRPIPHIKATGAAIQTARSKIRAQIVFNELQLTEFKLLFFYKKTKSKKG